MARRYSRLSKRLENQTKRNLVLSLVGIIVVGFLMVRYGFPILANVTGFISGFQKSNTSSSTKSDFVIAPILEELPAATNSSEFIVSGQAFGDQEVSIYINNTLLDSKETNDDGSFSFKIFLSQGENKIKAQASEGKNKSDFSDEEIVKFLNKAPDLEIKSPTDGQKFEKDQNSVRVTGSTDEGAKVTINDFWATIEGNNFSYTLPLQNGENNIKAVATDEAGNKTEKSIKVIYSP